ncbi:mCG131470, isoform CRA_b [Mus musculus]|nr:mCG131470, isoform CRA_b [Mus musculus]
MDSSIHLSGLLSRHDDDATRTSTSEGLEEGEVEGETLLIVESEDQASVDLSHDQSGDSLNSDEGDVSWMEEQLSYFCDKCQKWIPASQLREQLSYLKGDNFFRFTCCDCSADGKEQYERLKLTWQQVVMLAMYNLSLEGSGRQGYFRWKEDICAFIEKHWTFLLGNRQTALPARKGFRHQTTRFLYRLVGSEDLAVDQSIISPYTSRILKPYIRRDYETKPPKLQLLSQIRSHLHRSDPHWTPGPDAPLDYCYVRPNHIPTINSMCQEFFWPGIDLSECLQYPDFSVVVLYKKVIVAFGFMVPDVKYNEAYISFLLVHPEWRRAGIATFMIYHLIQTCMGKDVTLHVSASNPAMLLYQKFGFKTEEYVLDFYDKYYPLESTECKHAFFLRLRR